jgi:hypothetical protein
MGLTGKGSFNLTAKLQSLEIGILKKYDNTEFLIGNGSSKCFKFSTDLHKSCAFGRTDASN